MVFWRASRACGALDVLPESDVVHAGESVTGAVALHLERPLHDTLLTIAFVGHEVLNAVYSDDEGGELTTKRDRVLIHLTARLGQGALSAGDHVLPFSLTLPPGLNTSKSVHYNAQRDGYASDIRLKIVYSLQCQLSVRDADVASLEQALPITITRYPTAWPVGEPAQAAVTRAFRHAFFTKKDSCRLRVEIPTNIVRVGATIAARVAFSLSAPDRLRSVRLSLVRFIVSHVGSPMRDHEKFPVTVCRMQYSRETLGKRTEFVMELPVSEASAPEVDGVRKPVPFLPSETFYHVRVAYQVVAECFVRGGKPVQATIPVTFVTDGDAAPRA